VLWFLVDRERPSDDDSIIDARTLTNVLRTVHRLTEQTFWSALEIPARTRANIYLDGHRLTEADEFERFSKSNHNQTTFETRVEKQTDRREDQCRDVNPVWRKTKSNN